MARIELAYLAQALDISLPTSLAPNVMFANGSCGDAESSILPDEQLEWPEAELQLVRSDLVNRNMLTHIQQNLLILERGCPWHKSIESADREPTVIDIQTL